MQPNNRSFFLVTFLILFALLIGLVFLQSPGTTDVDIWRTWTKNADRLGLVEGFAANQADYPPFAAAILLGGYRLFGALGADLFLSIKLTIFSFLLLTVLVFWLWTRDLFASLVFYAALLLNTAALGYIDIFFAPSLTAALWMLKKNRLAWFSLFFTLSCLTKWQPLIIAPFILIYLLGMNNLTRWKEVAWKSLALKGLLPAAVLTAAVLLVYQPDPVWQALKASLSHSFLSGNALNLGWVITHFLHISRPEEFGGLVNHLSNYIMTGDPRITLVPRLLFFLFYLLTLGLFWIRPKTFQNLLFYSILGFLAYFSFNIGVHENHLFILMLPAVLVLWLDRRSWFITLALVLMFNANMLLFYGINGIFPFPRAFLGIDPALPLAVVYLTFFVWMFRNGILIPKSVR